MGNSEFITIHEPDGGSHRVHRSQLDYEPDKERQIENNEKVVDDKFPVDVTHKHIKPVMPKTYKETATEYYKDVYKNMPMEALEVDVNDIDSVVRLANDIAKNYQGNPSCYRIAGIIAAILDRHGVDYKCFAGAAKSNPSMSEMMSADSLGANHVWIETKGHKTYESFPYEQSKGKIVHLNITDEIIFKTSTEKKGAR